MDILPKHVFKALKASGVRSIYHANSLITSCQFLRHGALLSRGSVERLGFKQTPQTSDELDKRHSVWFDVFVDSVDIHDRASQENFYGPVLFVMDTALIEKSYTGKIWVAKLNPTKWSGKTQKQCWFQSKEDLETNFEYGDFDHMVVFRHCGGELPFRSYLREIVIDDPKIRTEEGVDLFSMAYGAVQLAMSDRGADVPIRKRDCGAHCRCRKNYRANEAHTIQMFWPGI